ncbi:MAG: hypothetical protein FWD69_04710 [Polyangiaceae bacterium]|nr:hypothetical protein [Polyangiaceae bacterium]
MKGRILVTSALAITWIFACSLDSTIHAGQSDEDGNKDENASVSFALSDGDFSGNSARICGSRPAPDPKYRCNFSLTPDIEAGADAGDACPCYNFAADGSLVDPVTGQPAVITGLCPSIDFPAANWSFRYEIFDAPDCTGTILNEEETSHLTCFDSHDIGSRLFFNQSVEALQPGLNTNHILCTTTVVPPPAPEISQACSTASLQSLLVRDGDVVAYIPQGRLGGGATGISVVNVEGSAITPSRIPTSSRAISCATNSLTGQTVCVANTATVYLLDGMTITDTLTSGTQGAYTRMGGGSKGTCQNCNVAMDPVHNRALIGMSVDMAGRGGYQMLDLGTNALSPLIPSKTANYEISDGPLIDPARNFVLASVRGSKSWEVIDVTDPATPQFFLRAVNLPQTAFDAVAEDCDTGIAIVAAGSAGGAANVYLNDLPLSAFIPGNPGSWTGIAQAQPLTGAILGGNAEFIAIAQGTHLGIVSTENTSYAAAIQLPSSSGTGTPAVTDYVLCQVTAAFTTGTAPQPIAAYKSPSNDHAMATLVNNTATTLAVVDLTMMLDPDIVPRIGSSHVCSAGTLPSSVVRMIAIP